MKTYKVLKGRVKQTDPGDIFRADLPEEQEQRLINRGLIEIVDQLDEQPATTGLTEPAPDGEANLTEPEQGGQANLSEPSKKGFGLFGGPPATDKE